MPDENKQDLNPTGEELEGLIAEKDKELAAKDSCISELEQRLTELNNRLSQVVSSYRALVIKSNPGVPEELITGDSIEAIGKSLADAQNLINKVRKEVEAEIAGTRVPAGAPQRTLVDLSALSTREKIQYAISERR